MKKNLLNAKTWSQPVLLILLIRLYFFCFLFEKFKLLVGFVVGFFFALVASFFMVIHNVKY